MVNRITIGDKKHIVLTEEEALKLLGTDFHESMLIQRMIHIELTRVSSNNAQ
jgi:hypothetical protein